MRYRSLSKTYSHQIATSLVNGEHVSVDARARSEGTGSDVDEESLNQILRLFRDELEAGSPKDIEVFEGRMAAALFGWFEEVPIEVLDDPGFWRYLSLKHFWWFIAWREKGPIANGRYLNLVDAIVPPEQIPLRLYLRAKSIAKAGDASLAGSIPKSTDFWRSHITRVRVGSAPRVARAFAELKRDEASLPAPLKTDRLREVAKRVNRTWSNVRLDFLEEDEARELMLEILEKEQ